MEKFLEALNRSYYTIAVIAVAQIIALLIGLEGITSDRKRKLFLLYIAFDLFILAIDIFFDSTFILSSRDKASFVVSTNSLIACVELFVYFEYFKLILASSRLKASLTLAQLVYVILIVIYNSSGLLFSYSDFAYFSYLLGAFEFLLIIPPCIAYFQQLFRMESGPSLFERPSFWVVTGIFFYASVSIPHYLLKKYLDSIQYSFRQEINAALFYTPIILNLVFIIKAFKCKKLITI